MSRRAPSDNREVDPRVVDWMRRAAAVAADSWPHPNPRVGALVIDPAGCEVAAAAHAGPGHPHAEVVALRVAGDAAPGSTVVTTLEPCTHHGLTPPCVDALIAANVAKVIVGAIDPDERVAGSGVEALEAAGIEVEAGVLVDEIVALDPGYHHHRRTGRPRFRLKLAATLDGQIAASDGTSQWITSPPARDDAHRLRARADAVMVGAGTLRRDDPLLDVRLDTDVGPQPRPIIIAGSEDLPAERRVYARNPIVYSPTHESVPPALESVVAGGAAGVDLGLVAKDLAERGLIEVLVDGGPRLATSFLAAGLADELTFYFAAKLAGGAGVPMFAANFATLSDAVALRITHVSALGPDVRIDARPVGEVS